MQTLCLYNMYNQSLYSLFRPVCNFNMSDWNAKPNISSQVSLPRTCHFNTRSLNQHFNTRSLNQRPEIPSKNIMNRNSWSTGLHMIWKYIFILHFCAWTNIFCLCSTCLYPRVNSTKQLCFVDILMFKLANSNNLKAMCLNRKYSKL